MLLQVLSWEEKARMLSKVWVAGIVIALLAVAIYLWLQYQKKIKQAQRFQKRGMREKTKVKSKVQFHIQANENLIKFQVLRNDEILAAMEAEPAHKRLILGLLERFPAADATTEAWCIKQIKSWSRKEGYSSIECTLKDGKSTDFAKLLLSEGFKRVQLSKEVAAQGKYKLKFNC